MMYCLKIEEKAESDLARLKKSEKVAYKKVVKLLEELQEHPTTGTGKPEH